MASQEGQVADPRRLGAEALEGLLAPPRARAGGGGARVRAPPPAAPRLLREPRLARARAATPTRRSTGSRGSSGGARDPGRARLRPRPRPQRPARDLAPRAARGGRARDPAASPPPSPPADGLLWRLLRPLPRRSSSPTGPSCWSPTTRRPAARTGPGGRSWPRAAGCPSTPCASASSGPARRSARASRAASRSGAGRERETDGRKRSLPVGGRGSRLEAIPARADERGRGGQGRAGLPRLRRGPRGAAGPGGRAHRGLSRRAPSSPSSGSGSSVSSWPRPRGSSASLFLRALRDRAARAPRLDSRSGPPGSAPGCAWRPLSRRWRWPGSSSRGHSAPRPPALPGLALAPSAAGAAVPDSPAAAGRCTRRRPRRSCRSGSVAPAVRGAGDDAPAARSRRRRRWSRWRRPSTRATGSPPTAAASSRPTEATRSSRPGSRTAARRPCGSSLPSSALRDGRHVLVVEGSDAGRPRSRSRATPSAFAGADAGGETSPRKCAP